MRIVFFTGAGISRESGLQTFRDSDGLWEGHRVEDVCSTEAWATAPARVLDFYNARRRAALAAEPNAAHKAIASLENSPHTVTVVTQNIDDLHERAGSTNVLHLHGEITKARSDRDDERLYPCTGDQHLGDLAPDGGQLRPHVVFFGEAIYNKLEAKSYTKRADVLVIVGTTLRVYPAAYVAEVSNAKYVYVVDPSPPDTSRVGAAARKVIHIAKPATEGVPLVVQKLLAEDSHG